MATSSIFKNFTEKVENKSLLLILKDIKSDTYKSEIESIRKHFLEVGKELADREKMKLLAFTPCGIFDNGRKTELIDRYSNFIIIDIDGLSNEQLITAKEKVIQVSYTFGAFISPKGNGLKILVEVNTDLDSHKIAFNQVSDHYEAILGLVLDKSGKDVSRLCFMSYDPDCYINIKHEIFIVDTDNKADTTIIFPDSPVDLNAKLLECIRFTNLKFNYVDGDRNNYIHIFACNANRIGVSLEETLEYALSNYDLPQAEIIATVKSAYQNNVAEFGKFAKFANIAKFADLQSEEGNNEQSVDYLKTTPTIPIDAIQKMPYIFREGARAFDSDPRKRDVYLTSALCIISGCLPDVHGVYHQERVYPHLFSFIIAPAASGKGALSNAKRLGDKIHERMVESSKQAKNQHENEMIEYKAQLSKRNKDNTILEKPQEPAFKLLFIPADCSQAMMMQILQDNDGRGIICETEADAMSGANKQDWGNYSHIMRAAFHHEKISAARKTNRELLEIKNPQLAVALSGTPSQVPKLITSAEDGLFSRFIFYAFKGEIVWRDPSPRAGGIVYNDHFEALSEYVIEMYDFFENSPTNINLTSEQWDILNNAFEDKLMNVVVFTSEEAASIVYRLGLILYRFCMIFTSLRKFENADTSKDVICTDEDFEVALILSDVYLEHSLLMFNNLEEHKESKTYKMPNIKKQLFEQLPHEFQRKEAIAIGIKLGLQERSVDNFLNNSVPKLLEKPKTGFYRKV